MLNQLNIKLLLPSVVVGFLGIIFVLFSDEMLSKTFILGLLVLMIVLQCALSYLFSQSLLTIRLAKLKKYLDLVVSTDEAPLGPLVDNNNDDLGEVINELSTFINGLSGVVEEIRIESDSVKQGAESLSAQMQQSVKSVDESADKIELMAQSIEQVASTSTLLSQNAGQVSNTTNQVLSILVQGSESSNTSQETIKLFTEEVKIMANDLALLQEECSRIGSVLDVIRSIADQTNLLALNAAIEAARAGEQGRGFAVVADEVRALAHRTQESTVEIQSMVEGLQSKSTNAVEAITRGKNLTKDSLKQSEQVVTALNQIEEAFTEVDGLTSQIADGTGQQQVSTTSLHENMSVVVELSRVINDGLSKVAKHSKKQQETSSEMDETLKKICV